MDNTKVRVKVVYEVEYEGKVTEEEVDLNDVLRDVDAIKKIDVKFGKTPFRRKE